MGTSQITPELLITEIDFKKYNLGEEEKDIVKKCKAVFVSQQSGNREVQNIKTLEFMKSVWMKYDCKEVAEIYDKFIKMEEALFGLLREEREGKRYRDHFIHMFNCFVFGVRFISSVFDQITREDFMCMFKVNDENLKEVGLPFGSNYKCHQRLFYMWTLASTFHDIAKPFQNLADLGKGINRFVDEFGWASSNPELTMHYFDSSQLHDYFHLISSVYGGGLILEDDGRRYKKDNSHHYLTKILGREFDRLDHGVLSGFFMWKTIEEIFLTDRSPKYPLSMEEFNLYTEHVLEQDIARVALAISLHGIGGIGKDKRTSALPKVYPISFGSFPLVFLLILSDELQEYLRWEGATVKKERKFTCHPKLDTKIDQDKKEIKMIVTFLVDKQDTLEIIEVANRMAKHNKQEHVTNIKDAVDLIGNSMTEGLKKRLSFDRHFMLQLEIHDEDDNELHSMKIGFED